MSDVSGFEDTLAAAIDEAVRHGRLGTAEAIIRRGRQRSLRHRGAAAALSVAAIGGAAGIALTAGGVASGDTIAAGTASGTAGASTSDSDTANPTPTAPFTPTSTAKPVPGRLTGTGYLPTAQWPGGANLGWSLQDAPDPATASAPATQGYASLKGCAITVKSSGFFPVVSSATWLATTNTKHITGDETVLKFQDAAAAAAFMRDAREAASQGACPSPTQDGTTPAATPRASTAAGVSWVVKDVKAPPAGTPSLEIYRYAVAQGDKVAMLLISTSDVDFPSADGDAAVLADMLATLK